MTVRVPDRLLDELRPFVESDWDRKRRDDGGKQLSPQQVNQRVLEWAYTQLRRNPHIRMSNDQMDWI